MDLVGGFSQPQQARQQQGGAAAAGGPPVETCTALAKVCVPCWCGDAMTPWFEGRCKADRFCGMAQLDQRCAGSLVNQPFFLQEG